MLTDVRGFCGWNILSIIHKLSEYIKKTLISSFLLFPHPICLAVTNRPPKRCFAPYSFSCASHLGTSVPCGAFSCWRSSVPDGAFEH